MDPELSKMRAERWENMTCDDVWREIERIDKEITERQSRRKELQALRREKLEKEELLIMSASEPSFFTPPSPNSSDDVPTSPSYTPGEDGEERYASGLGSLKANRKRPRTPQGEEGTKRPAVATSSAPEQDRTEPLSIELMDELHTRKRRGDLSPPASPRVWTCESEEVEYEYGHFAPA